jgi:hypothetical protein
MATDRTWWQDLESRAPPLLDLAPPAGHGGEGRAHDTLTCSNSKFRRRAPQIFEVSGLSLPPAGRGGEEAKSSASFRPSSGGFEERWRMCCVHWRTEKLLEVWANKSNMQFFQIKSLRNVRNHKVMHGASLGDCPGCRDGRSAPSCV